MKKLFILIASVFTFSLVSCSDDSIEDVTLPIEEQPIDDNDPVEDEEPIEKGEIIQNMVYQGISEWNENEYYLTQYTFYESGLIEYVNVNIRIEEEDEYNEDYIGYSFFEGKKDESKYDNVMLGKGCYGNFYFDEESNCWSVDREHHIDYRHLPSFDDEKYKEADYIDFEEKIKENLTETGTEFCAW